MNKLFYLLLLILFFITPKSYAENICFSTLSTADSGTIYDSGGDNGGYSNNERCGFSIHPSSSPTTLTLNFSEFNIETNFDFLYIDDGTSSTVGNSLGVFTGSSRPNTITSTTGSIYLWFESNFSVTWPGFTATWTGSTAEPELIASYNFDEDWISNNSLSDQTGSYSGLPSGSLTRELAPASGNKADTCYAATFSGGEIDISSLPVSTTTGAQTSISYWMYWDGTKNVMPLGWNQHALFFGADSSGTGSTIYFGFNTWGWDVTGITGTSASGLANGWHHVAAIFTNGSVANNKIYIDGILQPIAYRTGTVTTSNAYVQSTLVVGATSASSGWSFRGKIDNLKVYTGAITATQVTADMNESNSCPSTGGGDTPAINFNCVENGANGITGKLYTKTTAQSFSFDIVALQDANTIETNFANGADHTVTVELVNAEIVSSCDSYPALISAISQSLDITAADTGTKASANMSSSKAYSKVKCRVTDATDSPSVIGCSTDSFSIRPVSFSSITSSMDNTSSGSGTTARAGEDTFSITARTATTGYNGVPKYSSNLKDHNDATQSNKLSGQFSVADINTGEATGSNFKYDEVGLLKFSVNDIYDDSFSNGSGDIDGGDCTNDFSNTAVDGKVGCKFGNASATTIGRFIPHHFSLSEKNLTNRIDSPCSPASTFTYTGGKFQAGFKLTAENKSNNTTENYAGSYAKLDNGIIANFNFGATDTATSTELTASLSPVSSSGSWTNGVATITASLGLTRSSPHEPYNSFNLGIAPIDSDGIVLSSYDLDTDVSSVGNEHELLAITKIRFGRLNIDNAHGSELMSLPVPLYTEYYNGTSFITHTDDLCTAIAISDLSFNGGIIPITVGASTSIASIANSPLDAGVAGLSLSAPGITGYIDITTGIFISSYSWLGYDWDGDSAYDDAPSARATFGIYKGNTQQIYFREVY